MKILGINGGPNHIDAVFLEKIIHGQLHDSAVALLKDGDLIFALEEERTTRIKHTNYFPKTAIKQCMIYNDLDFDDIDYFAFPITMSSLENYAVAFMKAPLSPNAGLLVLREIFKRHTGYELDLKKIKLYDHHYCHAVSAFAQSGFYKSLVVTLDGAGNGLSGTIYTAEGNKLNLLKSFPVKKSLGYFYLEATEFLGMSIFDEYKVMGLAPYGDPTVHQELFESFYTLLPDGEYEIHFDDMVRLNTICPKRQKGAPFDQHHKDIAAALQVALEHIVFHILHYAKEVTGMEKICLAGGVALNCKMEGELVHSNLFKEVFVFPASGDNGLSSGAAYACHFETGETFINKPIKSVSMGLDFTKTAIESELLKWKDLIDYHESENIHDETGALLAEGEVIGWFRGREEYGPRALGNRSIVADPRPAANKDRINSIVKMREGFRPFAPAILEEHFESCFKVPDNGQKEFPFMSVILRAQESSEKALGAVVHIDGSARVQTVSSVHNQNFWKLINAFYQRTGTPVLLNTSFNNNYEPIVHSPADVIAFLLTSDVNFVVIGDFLIKKKSLTSAHPVFAKAGFYDFIRPASDQDERGRFLMHNSYLKEDKEISKSLWKILKEDQPFNLMESSDLISEIRLFWRQRQIKICPVQN
ncbi:carbamoyltransferase family protein [Pedobacter sp. AW31-3R]|uniref:carbamoyltransferase family protein n=1 Tax=Pedobacter sp. AW31-3R TaxID=3445781 RepID=UPI003FA175B7